MAVHNNDVYVVGQKDFAAMYWKNDTEVNLTDGSTLATATSVKVYNNDVYITGYERINEHYIAKYCKNSTAINLSDDSADSRARAIAVNKGNMRRI